MASIDQELKELLQQAARDAFDLPLEADTIRIDIPKFKEQGDYSSNLAMQLAKTLKKKPREIAETLVQSAKTEGTPVESIEIAGPGFLNFRLVKDRYARLIPQILEQGSAYGQGADNGVKVNLEYVSANPTGSLHLGHARGAAWGDAVARIMKKAGYEVTREYYINDAGNQIRNLAESLRARYLQALGQEAEIGPDGYLGQDIKDKGAELAEKYGDQYAADTPENLAFFRREGIDFELDKIKKDLDFYRVHFDVWSSEQALRDAGLLEKALGVLAENEKTYEQDGALWFRTTDYGDDKDRVLRKTDGSYTYLTPDIAYHNSKYERGFDVLVDFLGADHHGYITRLKGSMAALGNDPDKLNVDIIQMVRLVHNGEEAKMSKRLGNATTIRELGEAVGVDAARYFFVSRALDSQLDFDVELAVKQSSDNPVYYAQYAHARMCSILKGLPELPAPESYTRLVHEKEIDLLKTLQEYPSVVQDAARTRQAHRIVHYIQNLAARFHSFYNVCKVNDPADPELSAERAALISACRTVLADALSLIGVEAPESM